MTNEDALLEALLKMMCEAKNNNNDFITMQRAEDCIKNMGWEIYRVPTFLEGIYVHKCRPIAADCGS